MNAKKQPLRAHEDIVVFYKKQPTYHPQMSQGAPYDKGKAVRDTEAYGIQTKEVHVKNESGLRYPRSVIYFKTAESEGKYHPTQKPVDLYRWLIRTYSNEGDTVLDPCMGAGTTGIAANLANRRFLGIDQEIEFLEISKKRKIEIENPKIAGDYRQKINGFNDKKELTLFLANEPQEIYSPDITFKKKK